MSSGEEMKHERAGRRARTVIVVAIIVTLLLYYVIPHGRIIGYPLILLSTAAHEMGHGIAAVLVGGEFGSFVMHRDASGLAATATSGGRIARAIVAAGGLVGPSILAAIFFALASRAKLARAGLFVFGVAAIAACILVVRNLFGWVFVGAVAVASLVIALKASLAVSQSVIAFFATQLALSVFSRGDYLFTAEAHTATGVFPSDVANIADALFLPYWFWGGVCGLFSVAVLISGVWLFWRATRAPTHALEPAT